MSLTSPPIMRSLRHSGKCPPSLLLNWRSDIFEETLVRLVENTTNGPMFRQDPSTVSGVMKLVKLASDKSLNKRILEQRRGVMLAVIRTTSVNNKTLKYIIDQGFLVTIKSWLNQLLQYDIGGVDLLLHLLDCLYTIPVSKDQVVLSGIGKAIYLLERHKTCVSGRNEASIKTRTSRLKEKWMLPSKLSSSVSGSSKQSNRMDSNESSNTSSNKRSSLSSLIDSSESRMAKKTKKTSAADSRSNKLSTASLLEKVDRKNKESKKTKTISDTLRKPIKTNSIISAAEAARLKAQQRIQKEKARLVSRTPKNDINIVTEEEIEQPSAKDADLQVAGKTIRWADEIGLKIAVPFKSQYSEEEMYQLSLKSDKHSMSWSDRRKRDVMREKEMMNNAKKNIGQDDETEMLATIPWCMPSTIPPHPSIANVQVVSNEVSKQASRIVAVPLLVYKSAEEVPNDPKAPSDIDTALDTASMLSAVTETIPFFFSPQPQTSTYDNSQYQLPSNLPPAASTEIYLNAQSYQAPAAVQMPHTAPAQEASLEYVKSQGLPEFLAGSNVQALQQIASTPGLIDSYSNNPNSLSKLVNTLTQNLSAPVVASNPAPNTYNNSHYPSYPLQVAPPLPPMSSSNRAPPMHQQQQQQQHVSSRSNSNGFRGDTNSDANLHLSGYGPSTTEWDIRAIFAPYVEVREVAMKSSFSFVNTASAEGARHAREALRGAMLGGRPIRINLASKKSYEPDRKPSLKNDSSSQNTSQFDSSVGGSEFDNIRDERGNPATKNLFVAGFGNGTTEKQLFDLFSQQVTITGTMFKGTYAFINTTDKAAAIKVRGLLSGATVNGGPIRINFAKESGRLGTSFDNNYNGPIGARVS